MTQRERLAATHSAPHTRAHTHRQRLAEEESSLHSRVVGHLKYYFDALWIACGRLGRKTLRLPLLFLFQVLRLQIAKETRVESISTCDRVTLRKKHFPQCVWRVQRSAGVWNWDSPVASSPQPEHSAGPSPPLASAAPAPPSSCGPSPGQRAGTPGRPRPAAASAPASGSSPPWTKHFEWIFRSCWFQLQENKLWNLQRPRFMRPTQKTELD